MNKIDIIFAVKVAISVILLMPLIILPIAYSVTEGYNIILTIALIICIYLESFMITQFATSSKGTIVLYVWESKEFILDGLSLSLMKLVDTIFLIGVVCKMIKMAISKGIGNGFINLSVELRDVWFFCIFRTAFFILFFIRELFMIPLHMNNVYFLIAPEILCLCIAIFLILVIIVVYLFFFKKSKSTFFD